MLSILFVYHFAEIAGVGTQSHDSVRVAYSLQKVVSSVDKLNAQMEQHADMERLIEAAASNAGKVFEKKKEDTLHEIARQLWRLQETESRERVEQKKIDNPRQRVINNSLKPNGSDIVLVSAITRDYPKRMPGNMFDQMKGNRENYCKKHGYINFMAILDDYINDSNKDMNKNWFKLYALKDAFDKYPDSQWFMWLDADLIIMEETIDLASLVLNPEVMRKQVFYNAPLADRSRRYRGAMTASEKDFDPERIELIACQDEWFLNAGVFLIKRTDFMRNMIDEQWLTEENMKRKLQYHEQDCLNDLVINNKELRKRFVSVPQSVFNAYHEAYSFEPSKWKEGDFIVHFPGESKKDHYPADWSKYWDKKPEKDDYN